MLADTGMPAEWRLETLGNLAHYLNGRAFKPEDWGDTGLPIIRIEQINNPEAECDYFGGVVVPDHVIDDGDLLFSWSATLTTLVWNRGPAALNQHIFKVVPRSRTDRDYLHHLLDSLIEGFAGQAHGSTMQHIKKSDLLPYPVHVPPLPEQRRIAEILDTADRAIGETEALISKLKHTKTGLMHDLLTRGLDEHGQLRDPDAHPEQFKDSPLGRIPWEWESPKIGSIASHVGSGLTPRGGSEVYKTQGVLFIRSQNVTFEGLKLNDVAYIDPQTHESMKRSEVFAHDVLLNITGASIGRCCPLPSGLGATNVNQHVCVIRLPHPSREDATFLSSVLASHIGQSQIDRLNAGSNRQGLNYQQLRGFVVPWAPERERARIAEILDAHDARIRAEEAYRDKLKLQKKGLMDDLLTGRVRVKMAQEVGA